MFFVFINVVGGDTASHHGKGIEIRVSADDGARIENAVASDIRPVAEHGADLAKARLHVLPAAVNNDILLIGLHIGGDGSGAHVRVEAQNAVADIVVMRDFYLVEKHHILELCGISDSGAISDDRASADKCALSDSCIFINDAGAADISAVKDNGTLCHPDVLASLLESVLRQLVSQGDYEIALDYEIKENGLKPSYQNYRIFQKFRVRNANCMVYLFDTKTGTELQNNAITENGFYIDLARSRYLNIGVKRWELVNNSIGTIENPKYNSATSDKRTFTTPGVYDITVSNQYTGETTTKRVFVGNDSLLQEYIAKGISLDKSK